LCFYLGRFSLFFPPIFDRSPHVRVLPPKYPYQSRAVTPLTLLISPSLKRFAGQVYFPFSFSCSSVFSSPHLFAFYFFTYTFCAFLSFSHDSFPNSLGGKKRPLPLGFSPHSVSLVSREYSLLPELSLLSFCGRRSPCFPLFSSPLGPCFSSLVCGLIYWSNSRRRRKALCYFPRACLLFSLVPPSLLPFA